MVQQTHRGQRDLKHLFSLSDLDVMVISGTVHLREIHPLYCDYFVCLYKPLQYINLRTRFRLSQTSCSIISSNVHVHLVCGRCFDILSMVGPRTDPPHNHIFKAVLH